MQNSGSSAFNLHLALAAASRHGLLRQHTEPEPLEAAGVSAPFLLRSLNQGFRVVTIWTRSRAWSDPGGSRHLPLSLTLLVEVETDHRTS